MTRPKRGARLAVTLAVAGSLSVGFAGSAGASHTDKAQTNAYAVAVTTPILTVGPLAVSHFPDGPASSTAAKGDVAGLLTAGALESSSDQFGSEASVANAAIQLDPENSFSAKAVSSSCSVDPETGGVSGQASLVDAVFTSDGTAEPISVAPPPNTVIPAEESPLAVTLNRQTPNADGSLTVDAVAVTLPDGSEVVLASSTCHPANLMGVSMMPTEMAVGVGVAAVLGAGVFAVRRRRAALALR